MNNSPNDGDVFAQLDAALAKRRTADPAQSYTAALYAGGVTAITDKISEESAEVVEAAHGDDHHLIHEVADLWFHCMVLLQSRGLDSAAVQSELARRFGVSGHVEKAARSGGDTAQD
ncbi:phosphoribosyl-ATP diphosphatase [Salinisphaera sp. SPP-AMP-43]|uniref:phosphoribosyl-ATP diphosphatase n=1 Tax=Salinisphaera sp. SPP-AMP-43 TaxID=3121288 RepID=UPI003C6DBDB0